MITTDELQIAADFAARLHDKGVGYADLAAATTDEQRLDAVVHVLKATAPIIVAERPRTTTPRTPVEDAIASMRITNRLRIDGIMYLEELTALTDVDLLQIRNLGTGSLRQIREALGQAGLELRTSPEPKAAALERLYGDVAHAPLTIVFFGMWDVYQALKMARITTVEDLLSRSWKQLAQITHQDWIWTPEGRAIDDVLSLTGGMLRAIEGTLSALNLSLREE